MRKLSGEGDPRRSDNALRNISPIERSRGALIKRREEIKELVEQPLLSACEEFFDKGILTVSSSANTKDLAMGYAHIVLDYDSLSDENKEIGLRYGRLAEDGGVVLVIEIPVHPDVTTEEVQSKAEEIVHEFKKQKPTWIPSYTVEQMRQVYGIDPDDAQYPAESFASEGWYYDAESKRLFYSQEHAQLSRA